MDKEQIDNLLVGSKRTDYAGWNHIKISGDPYQCGFQHGYLLASEIKDAIRVAKFLCTWNTGESWELFKENGMRLFAEKLTDEYTQELLGIVHGASENGFETSFEEIITWNGYQDLLGSWWPEFSGSQPTWFQQRGHRCSAFVATGDSTSDGGIVMAHNTWYYYAAGDHFCNIIDITPQKGHRMVFQAQPGIIASIIDWWVTEAGLMINETTIGGFKGFDGNGAPEFMRSRYASQYANNIAEWKYYMSKDNNGGYASSWLLGDINTNEIARVEMGLKTIGFQTTKDGYFSGYNIAENLKIRNQECGNEGYSDITRSGARRLRFLELLDGKKVSIDDAKKIIADHKDVYLNLDNNPCGRTICGHLELDDAKYGGHAGSTPYYPWGASDGKVMDSAMAKNMSFEGRWGHACGMPFDVDAFFKEHRQYEWLKGYMKSRPTQDWVKISG